MYRANQSLLLLGLMAATLGQAQVYDFENGFTAGSVLNGQNGWIATTTNWPNWVVTESGVTWSSNNEIAVLDTPVNLSAGEAFTFRIDFFLQEWNDPSDFVPPAEGQFYELWTFGLKTDNSTMLVERVDPLSGGIHVQGLAEGIRLLDGAYGSAMITESVVLALGISYSASYTLNLGSDAASSSIDVILTNNLQETSATGKVDGIAESLYADITSGNGAYMYMQTLLTYGQPNGIDGMAVDTVTIGAEDPLSWHGYTADDMGWADTEGWIGWVNITDDPWIWVINLGHYIYLPSDTNWAFVPR